MASKDSQIDQSRSHSEVSFYEDKLKFLRAQDLVDSAADKSYLNITTDALPSYRERTNTLAKLIVNPQTTSNAANDPSNTFEEDHHTRLGAHAAVLWKCNKITDITVKLRGIAYPAHKTVLSCYSKYFKEKLLESKGTINVLHLNLQQVTNEAFAELLKFMYMGNLHLTVQNIGQVYTAARKLGMENAQQLCVNVLTGKSRHTVHSVYVYVTAKNLNIEDSAAKAFKTMCKKFEQIVGTPEFTDLNCEELCEYLSADELATRSEVIVYLSALKWLSVRYLEREPFAADVLACVRFQEMNLNEVLACYSPPLLPGITEIKEIKERLLKATCYVAAKTVNEEKRFEEYACKPRTYLLPREAILLWDTNIFDKERYAIYSEDKAATTIQAHFKGFQARKELEEMNEAAKVIQHAFRRFSNPQIRRDHLESRERAAEEEMSEDKMSRASSSEEEPGLVENLRKSVTGLFWKYDDGGSESRRESKQRRKSSWEENSSLFRIRSDTKREEQQRRKTYLKQYGIDSSAENDTNGEERPRRESYLKHYGSDSRAKNLNGYSESDELKIKGENGKLVTNGKGEKISMEKAVKSSESLNVITSQTSKFSTEKELYSQKFSTERYQSMDEISRRKGTIHRIYREVDSDKNQARGSLVRFGSKPPLPLEITDRATKSRAIMITGGFESDKLEDKRAGLEIFIYEPLEDRWSKFGSMSKARHHHCSIYLDGFVYIIGGCDPAETLEGKMMPRKSCFKFDVKNKVWDKIAKMHHSRMYHGVSILQGKIYVVGGKDRKDRLLRSVEVYDPKSNEWYELDPALDSPTMGMGVTTHGGRLWVIGGIILTLTGRICVIKDVNCYDPKTGRWMPDVRDLPQPLAFTRAETQGDKVIIIGGTSYTKDGEELMSLNSVLMHDFQSNWWTSLSPLPSPRHFVEACVLGRQVYTLGGLNSLKPDTMDDVLFYDEGSDEWKKCKPLPLSLCGFSATVVPATS